MQIKITALNRSLAKSWKEEDSQLKGKFMNMSQSNQSVANSNLKINRDIEDVFEQIEQSEFGGNRSEIVTPTKTHKYVRDWVGFYES